MELERDLTARRDKLYALCQQEAMQIIQDAVPLWGKITDDGGDGEGPMTSTQNGKEKTENDCVGETERVSGVGNDEKNNTVQNDTISQKSKSKKKGKNKLVLDEALI